jgi:hypothetical protein
MEAEVKQDRQISAADEMLHDPFLARVSALDILPSEQRRKWLEEQCAALRAARRAVRPSGAARYDKLVNRAHVAIIDAQLRCLDRLQCEIAATSER